MPIPPIPRKYTLSRSRRSPHPAAVEQVRRSSRPLVTFAIVENSFIRRFLLRCLRPAEDSHNLRPALFSPLGRSRRLYFDCGNCFSISFTIRSAESGMASASILRLNSDKRAGSFNSPTASSMTRATASESGISSAAPLSANARAFLVWWSSATLGDGTKRVGLATRQSSDTVQAPLRETTRSAAA